ncbi:MAG: type IV pili twitching motility protein PilT, partial [Oscillospiraceae bacterium]
MAELLDYLSRVVQDGASDLFIIAGGPVCEKLENRLVHIGEDRVMPEESERLITDLYAKAGRSMDFFKQAGDDDFSFALPGLARFRANTYRQRGSMAAVIRVVAFGIPDWKGLGIPEEVMKLAQVKHGMILVTGTAGSGKSTTQACISDLINQTR